MIDRYAGTRGRATRRRGGPGSRAGGPVMDRLGQRRGWVPDVRMIADQLIEDYRCQIEVQGNLDALGTMTSWQATATDHGEEFTEDDWMALVQELARRCAGGGLL